MACLLTTFMFTSCKPKLKTVRGLVTNIETSGDTLKSMTLVTEGGKIVFFLDNARYNEGIMLNGDSIIVDYIKGKTDTARALVITVLPKKPHFVDTKVDTTKELLTIPLDSLKKK